jgi:hypothetical protein
MVSGRVLDIIPEKFTFPGPHPDAAQDGDLVDTT